MGGLEREAVSCVPGRSTRKLHRRDLQKVSGVWSD